MMAGTGQDTQDDEGVPRLYGRAHPRYPRGFMANPGKTYRLPTRAAIRPGGDLRDTDLIKADLRSADLRGADLSGADLFQADLTDADLTGANLTGACLYNTHLRLARVVGANLERAELSNLDCSRANLEAADLSVATVSRADLTGATLRTANLSGAILFWSGLAGVDLSGANLTGAVVRAPGTWQLRVGEDRGSLGGAVLDGAILDGIVVVRDWPRRTKYRRTYPRPPRIGDFAEATRKVAIARAGNRCEHCQAIGKLDVDHVIAIADGGTGTIDNTQVLCKPCHVAKTLRDLIARGGGSQARWIGYLKEVARVKAERAEAARIRKAARQARKDASVNPDA